MLCTYHNHSTWSDGKASIGELVSAAAAFGIDELGVSDHFVLHLDGRTLSWSMPTERLREYVTEVQSFQGRSHPPAVRLGLEVDWFPGHADALRAALADIPFDYLIGSVHDVDGFVIDGTAGTWDRLSQREQDDVHERYWVLMRSLAESGLFDIAAHLDLSKKFGHRSSRDLTPVIESALDAIAAAGLVVELNTAGWHKPVADGYPSIEILRGCRARDIPVTISADAHRPQDLLRDFDRAAERLESVGYDKVARFAGRERRFEPIAIAVP